MHSTYRGVSVAAVVAIAVVRAVVVVGGGLAQHRADLRRVNTQDIDSSETKQFDSGLAMRATAEPVPFRY
jgi:hypothetical protein